MITEDRAVPSHLFPPTPAPFVHQGTARGDFVPEMFRRVADFVPFTVQWSPHEYDAYGWFVLWRHLSFLKLLADTTLAVAIGPTAISCLRPPGACIAKGELVTTTTRNQ